MKTIESRVRRACADYNMLDDGDRIAVAVSGGKDSLVLLCALAALQKYSEHSFELCAITLDGRLGGGDTDFSAVQTLCERLGVEYVVRRTDLGDLIFNQRQEPNPCSLCARMRRGALHDMTLALGCNKIALGHHMDDLVETFFLNLFHEGRIAAFSPVSFLTRKEITMIRPLLLCSEKETSAAARRAQLPVVKSGCPQDGVSGRQDIKNFIAAQTREYPDFLNTTFGALRRAHISGL